MLPPDQPAASAIQVVGCAGSLRLARSSAWRREAFLRRMDPGLGYVKRSCARLIDLSEIARSVWHPHHTASRRGSR